MPVYPQTAAFMQLVLAVNPNYSRVKPSSLAPLVNILNNPAGTAGQVCTAIANVAGQADPVYVNKANKYKAALHFLQRTYPIPAAQWVRLGAQLSRAAAFNQFVAGYATIVVMGFDADICVRANMFGAPEYPDNAVAAPPGAATNSLPSLTSQANVVTSRALLVTTGTVGPAEYGPIQGL